MGDKFEPFAGGDGVIEEGEGVHEVGRSVRSREWGRTVSWSS